MPTLRQAAAIALALADVARKSRKPGLLHRIYLYDDIVTTGEADQVLIILEIQRSVFELYEQHCRFDLDGLNPWSKLSIRSQPSCTSLGRHASLIPQRTNTALEFAGISLQAVKLGELSATGEGHPPVTVDHLNIICLPVGWDDETAAVYRRLAEQVQASQDPGFLDRARAKRRMFYPVQG
ncbi:MAG: hypothetical protein E6Q06_00475 [Candidatus Moraniibacteriota bacterium]|nr:MAG: hypothetical protein E6Q06_00475 [Candidatus Moranbacteria bacterium]